MSPKRRKKKRTSKKQFRNVFISIALFLPFLHQNSPILLISIVFSVLHHFFWNELSKQLINKVLPKQLCDGNLQPSTPRKLKSSCSRKRIVCTICSPLKRINLSEDAWECPGFLLQFTFSSFVRTSWSGAVTRFNTSPGRDPSDPFPQRAIDYLMICRSKTAQQK